MQQQLQLVEHNNLSLPFESKRVKLQHIFSYKLNNLQATQKFITYESFINNQCYLIVSKYSQFDKNIKPTEIQIEDDQYLFTFKYLEFNSKFVLVVVLSNIIRIYSEDGNKIISSYKMDQGKIDQNGYFNGISLINVNNEQVIIVGNSFGGVIGLYQQKNKIATKQIIDDLNDQNNPINNLEFSQNFAAILSISTKGQLSFQIQKENKENQFIKQRDMNLNDMEVPITSSSLMSRLNQLEMDEFLVAGDFCGKITVLSCKHFQIIAIISSHSRLISQIDIFNDNFEIMSIGEDSYQNFWILNYDAISKEYSAKLKVSFRIADQVLVGSQYIRNQKGDSTIVSIYDSNDITLIKYLKNK